MSKEWKSQCTTCQFYNDRAGASNCLRYPPQVVVTEPAKHEQHDACGRFVGHVKYDLLSKFPAVAPDDWCGEYQPEKIGFRKHMQEVL